MNDPQRSTLDASRPTETAPDDVFALTPCSVDGASISAGTLCLVMPGGEAVRIPVDRERVGAVARALMLRPAVLLLAREGVALPRVLPVEIETDAVWGSRFGDLGAAVLELDRGGEVESFFDRIPDAAVVEALRGIETTIRDLSDRLGDAINDARSAQERVAPLHQSNRDLRTNLDAAKREHAELTRAVLAAAQGGGVDVDAATPEHRTVAKALQRMSDAVRACALAPVDTALPGVVVFADRLRDIARPLPPGALRCDLLRLAGDLSRATDPCRGYPSAEEVLAVCDAVIEDMHCGGESLFAEGCERLRSRLAEAMDARPSKAPAPAADPLAELREAQRDSRAAHDAMDILRVALATLAETGSVEADPALVQAVGETTVRDLLDLHARISADRPKAYAYGLQDAGVAVAGVALGYAAHSGARAVADQCQDAIAALRSQARKTSVMPVQVTADAIDGWADTLLDLAYRPDARERAVALAETLRVAAANHEVRP